MRPHQVDSRPSDRTQEHYVELQEIAARNGLLADMAKKTRVPEALKGAWGAVVGLFQREEAAMAGIWDVIQGTDDTGDNVGMRFIREALGGTKVGNALGLPEPTREMWADVLKQGGTADGANLSDMIGENWFTRYFDPNQREATALGLSILTAPSTWLSAGSGGAAKFAGRAGWIKATPKAEAMAQGIYKTSILRYGKAMGKTIEDFAGSFDDMERAVLGTMRDRSALRGLGEQAIEHTRDRMMLRAQRKVADLAIATKDSTLIERTAIRLGEHTPFSGSFRGIPLVDLPTSFGKPGEALAGALRANRVTAPLINAVATGTDWVDQVFNRIPRHLRKKANFVNMERSRFVLRNSAEEIASRRIDELFGHGELRKLVRNNIDFSKAWMRAADAGALKGLSKNSDALLENLRTLSPNDDVFQEAVAALHNWDAIASLMGDSASHLRLIEPDQIARFAGRYIPHSLKLDDKYVQEFYRATRGEFSGGSVTPYSMHRVFDTFDELEEMLVARGLDPDKVIEWSPEVSILKYIRTHVEGVADAQFANDLVAEFSPTFDVVFRELSKDIPNLTKEYPESVMRPVYDAVLEYTKFKGFPALSKAIPKLEKKLMSMDQELRLAFVHEVLGRAKDFGELDRALLSMRKLVDSIDLDTFSSMNKLRRTAYAKEIRLGDDIMVQHTLKRGIHKNVEVLMPKRVAEWLDEQDKMMSLSKPVEGLLKTADLLTNTFKGSHTILFPSFHNRNAISNVAAMAIEVGLFTLIDPKRLYRVATAMLNEGDWTYRAAESVVGDLNWTKKVGGRRYTRQQYTGLMEAMDVMPKRNTYAELVGKGHSLVSKIPILRKIETSFGRIGQVVENSARGVYMDAMLSRGMEPMEAAAKMKQVLFDYQDLSRTERELLRRIIPFYTWTRKNAELQVRNILTKPGQLGKQIRVLNAGDRGPDADLLPEYKRGEMKIALEAGPGKALFITGLDLPINSIDVLWAGSFGATMRQHWGMVNPAIKYPLEFMLNLDTFTMQSQSGRKWMGKMGPIYDKALPKWAKDYLEMKKVQASDGEIYYTANGTKIALLPKALMLGRILKEGATAVAIAKELGGGNSDKGMPMLFNFLSGMEWTEFDIAKAQKKQVEAISRECEDYLLEKGVAIDFRRVYDPKQKRN